MATLAQYFQEIRTSRKIGLGALAKMIGYLNLDKGARRIESFEKTGEIDIELLGKLAKALEIDPGTVDRLIAEDRRQFIAEWNAWANVPIKPYLVVRLVPAFYQQRDLPPEIASTEEAEAYASAFAKEQHKRCCLVISRRHSIWFDENGQVENRTEAGPGQRNEPVMHLGGRDAQVRSLTADDFARVVNWPKRLGPPPTPQE